jgi:hypothetical protein
MQILLHVLIPLLSGVLIYALWRGIAIASSKPLFVFNIPYWLKYNLPDGLWLYALLSSLNIIWNNKPSPSLLIWVISITLLSISTEFLQKKKLIPGTYDTGDIIAYVIASTICLLRFLYETKRIYSQTLKT